MPIIKNPLTVLAKPTRGKYTPNADMVWCKSVLENDIQEGFEVKAIQMISDKYVYSTFYVPEGGAVKTSDGVIYTTPGQINHTWNDTNVHAAETYDRLNLRWFITYYSNNEGNKNLTLVLDVMYVCYKGLPDNSVTFTSSFSNKFSLEYFEFINTTLLTGTNFQEMFRACYSLQSVPELNTAQGTNFQQMFYGCSSLQSVPELNTAQGTNFQQMFYGCYSLQSVPELNLNLATSVENLFYSDGMLEFLNIENIGLSLTLTNSMRFSRETLVNILNNLKTIEGQTLTLGATNLNKLTEEDKAIAINKGWILN